MGLKRERVRGEVSVEYVYGMVNWWICEMSLSRLDKTDGQSMLDLP